MAQRTNENLWWGVAALMMSAIVGAFFPLLALMGIIAAGWCFWDAFFGG